MNSDNVRMLIGLVIIMVILVIWQLLFPYRSRPVTPSPPPAESTATPGEPEPTVLAGRPEPEYHYPETTFTLSNRLLEVKISSHGGALRSCSLKNYRVQLVPDGRKILGIAEVAPYPPASWQETDTSLTLAYETPACRLTLTWRIRDNYTLELILDAQPARRLTIDASAGIATTETNLKEDLANFHFYTRMQGRVQQIAAPNLRRKPFSGIGDWAGIKSKYFFLALVNLNGTDSCQAGALPDGRIGMQIIRTGSENPGRYLVYLGPIEYKRLRQFGIGFENVVSLGWLKPVALAILYLLRLFYKLVHNWGVAIILFSVLMKLIFYPLTRTQTRQMRQLQLLQPKLEELKRKYKDDPQQLNQETMRLYQLYRVNPLSGCLPLLVQMPVFFALYAVLRNFIELRGAGFILWLQDLSQPDTLFGHIPAGVPLVGGFALGLLPILMGASFIAQNLLTTTDRRNWALTIIFPIFITAIFLNLSSGLQLYWFIYNLLSIGESLIVTKGGQLWQRFSTTPKPGAKS